MEIPLIGELLKRITGSKKREKLVAPQKNAVAEPIGPEIEIPSYIAPEQRSVYGDAIMNAFRGKTTAVDLGKPSEKTEIIEKPIKSSD